MKKLLLLLLVSLTFNINAQNEKEEEEKKSMNRWTIGLAFNTVENNGNGSGNPFNNFLAGKREDANSGTPLRLNIGYRMSELFGLEVSGSSNKWNAYAGVMDGVLITEDYDYFSVDASLKFYLDELLLDESINWVLGADWLDVYLTGGIGYFKINEGGVSANLGIGTDIWLTKNIGVGAYWVGKWALEDRSTAAQFDTNHTQYSLGLTYRFNYTDKDKDGIYDYNDRCVNVPGRKANNGCPDNENPETPEICVEEEEEKVKPSIIDTDGDGVVDSADNCPGVSGLASNNGCPITDTDGDGVIDSADNCPSIAGSASNDGCPIKEVVVETPTEITMLAKQIQFETGKTSFTGETYNILQEIISYMKKYPNSKFRIEGHTDSIGSYSANRILSQKRASEVKAYLVSNGVSASNLEAIGFGERKPIESNMLKAGRKINRRVEIIQVN